MALNFHHIQFKEKTKQQDAFNLKISDILDVS